MLRPQQENFCQIKYGIVWPKSIILMLLMLYSLSSQRLTMWCCDGILYIELIC